ncbi:MAG: hypothetical protein JW784_04180 [Candidatus Cloacimonetes bacterium]|nr:hypothetical protein [Candidatus Cloacimonadota bacterium]
MKSKLIITLILITTTLLAANEDHSIRKSMFFSLLTPGLGQIYNRDYTKAGIFLTTELIVIASYFRLNAETGWAINSYQQFAWNKAFIPINSSDEYYQLVQDFISSEDYNAGVINFARNVFLSANSPYYNPEQYYQYLEDYLIPPDLAWDWQLEKNWLQYRELRRNKQDLEIYKNFAFAAAILNRIVSVVDAAISARKIKKTHLLSNLNFQPDWQKKGVRIFYEYKF